MLLLERLRRGAQMELVAANTFAFGRGRGSVQELSEGLILLQALGKLCCTLISNLVVRETASKRTDKVSEAANACLCVGRGRGSVLERREALILLEALGERFCTLISNRVPGETANERAAKVSAAFDSMRLALVFR
jgi:hypothetical protein